MWQTNCGNGIAEIGRKKKFVLNCGNAIAEIGRKKNFVLAIVAMTLSKMGKKKCYEICERVKKKSCHVHNIFTIFSQ